MAEIGQFSNFPTYPGLGPWVNTNYEQDLTGDYRIDEKNLPCTRFAVLNEIFSDDELDGSQFLGVIIPLPSALLIGFTGFVPIVIRGSYRNWLNTGYALSVIATNDVKQSGIRPPTFHYHVLEKYKEVVHYGFEMIVLGVSNAVGSVRLFAVNSFIPYLEYRIQSILEDVSFVDGIVSSVSYDDGRVVIGTGWNVNAQPTELDVPIKLTAYPPPDEEGKVEEVTYEIDKVLANGDLVTKTELDESTIDESLGNARKIVGRYFILDVGIQVKDPSMLYSEIARDDRYYRESTNGYDTREQSLSDTGTFVSFFYDKATMEKVIRARIELLSGEDPPEDESDGMDAMESLYLSMEVEDLQELLTHVESQDVVYESLAEQKFDDDGKGEKIFSILNSLGGSSTYVRVTISSSTSFKHNFGAGTQIGSIFKFNDGESYYPILDHPRSEMFLVANESVGGTLSEDLQEGIFKGLNNTSWEVNSSKMWTMTDITTNRSSSDPSLNTGVFSGSVISSVKVDKEEYAEDVPEEEREKVTKLAYVIDDKDYHGLDYLSERYLTDDDPDDVVKAWKKYDGWVLYRRRDEESTGFPIENVEIVDGEGIVITLQVEVEEFAEDHDDYESNIESEWWIGFNSAIPIKPQTLDYVSTPFLGMNALLGEDGSGTENIIFDGVYVGSPVEFQLDEDAAITLIENTPVVFDPSVASIKVSSAKEFKYISFDEDVSRHMEHILYTRDDDRSNALYARRGQIDYLFGIDESLVYTGEPELVEVTVEGPSGLSNVHNLFYDGDDKDDHDIVGMQIVKKNPEHKKSEEGKYDHTMWMVYHGDRLMGYKSLSGRENTEYSRAAGVYDGEIKEMPFYHYAQYFLGKDKAWHSIPGNVQTSDPLVGEGNVRLIPVLNWDPEQAPIGKAYFEMVENGSVLRDVKSRSIFPYNTGGRVLLTNQPQNFVDGSIKEISSTKTVVEGDFVYSDVDLEQDGVFLSSTNDDYKSFEPGMNFSAIGDGDLMKHPFLLSSNMAEASYSFVWPYVNIAGYTKIRDGLDEMIALSFRRCNLLALPKGGYSLAIGEDDVTLFSYVSDNVFMTESLIIGSAESIGVDFEDVTPEEEGGEVISPFFVDSDLDIEPFDMDSNGQYMIIVVREGGVLRYFVSSSVGKTWAYFDDINIASEDGRRVSAPSVKIIGSGVHLFYFRSGTDLMYKSIPLSLFGTLQSRYSNNKRSSDEESEEWITQKQELQAAFDNIESVKVSESFEQKVAFGSSFRGRLQVVYYDEDGFVSSAISDNMGNSWTTDTVNF
jgi:hypothetical protein